MKEMPVGTRFGRREDVTDDVFDDDYLQAPAWEEGARAERERIVAWLKGARGTRSLVELSDVSGRALALSLILGDIASGKHWEDAP